MPAPVVITNDSDVTRLEGLYVKERTPPAEISGVALNDVAIVGTAVRGPVDKLVECGSPARFLEVFGGRDYGNGTAFISDIWKTLQNKFFGRLYVGRVGAAAAVKATKQFLATATPIIRVDASSPGVWGNQITVQILAATNGVSTSFDLIVTYGSQSKRYQNLSVNSTDDNLATTLGNDDANWITIAKLANGRPDTIAATALLTGADGTVADGDYTATPGQLERAAAQEKAAIVLVAEYMSGAIKTKMQTLAAANSDRVFIVGPNSETVAYSAAATDVGTLSRGDRLIYTFNHAYTLDSTTGLEMLTSPVGWLASILSQIDVDIHPGEEDTKKYTAGISRLYHSTLDRAAYISLKEAGICALENYDGKSFVSGVTTSLVPGKEQITRRRMVDFLIGAGTKALKYYPKKKNTISRRAEMKGLLDIFSEDLKKAERVVENFKVDGEVLNTEGQRSLGVEKIFWKVKLINHMLHLVLEVEAGTNVIVREAA